MKEAPDLTGSRDNEVPIANSAMPPESCELNTKRGRPRVRRDIAKAYRTTERLQLCSRRIEGHIWRYV